jgi:hypothetical protein
MNTTSNRDYCGWQEIDRYKGFEVVGNIYKNGDLLK